jgi:hypothetical protein
MSYQLYHFNHEVKVPIPSTGISTTTNTATAAGDSSNSNTPAPSSTAPSSAPPSSFSDLGQYSTRYNKLLNDITNNRAAGYVRGIQGTDRFTERRTLVETSATSACEAEQADTEAEADAGADEAAVGEGQGGQGHARGQSPFILHTPKAMHSIESVQSQSGASRAGGSQRSASPLPNPGTEAHTHTHTHHTRTTSTPSSAGYGVGGIGMGIGMDMGLSTGTPTHTHTHGAEVNSHLMVRHSLLLQQLDRTLSDYPSGAESDTILVLLAHNPHISVIVDQAVKLAAGTELYTIILGPKAKVGCMMI